MFARRASSMPDALSRDGTLPAVDIDLTAPRRHGGLSLTVIFHPDPGLIGAACQLFAGGETHQRLGREAPGFLQPGAVASGALGERHVSRLALSLHARSDGLRLTRPDGASRCLVDGLPLEGSVLLPRARLRAGVGLQLAHSVVLLLREQLAVDPLLPAVAPSAGLFGNSPAMLRLRQAIHRAAAIDRDVLVLGESGSGKEGVARALHRSSRLADGPWVAVNMSAIPAGVAAAELFGSERGAFTGAERGRPGYFRQAAGGTLFLDEVGDTPAEVQPLLLRALQEREIQPVGGQIQRIDLRVVAATELDLDSGEYPFRSSLRYRLAGMEITVPALRERPEDIGLLLCLGLRQACEELGAPFVLADLAADPGRAARWAQVFARSLQYHWPGNVRELLGCARQLVLDGGRGPRLPAVLQGAPSDAIAEPDPAPPEDGALLALLAHHDYDMTASARAAGISRGVLYRRLPALGLRLARDIPELELRRVLAEQGGSLEAAARALRVSRVALQARLRGAADG